MYELNPCPECGAKAQYSTTNYYEVFCTRCGKVNVQATSKAIVTRYWNSLPRYVCQTTPKKGTNEPKTGSLPDSMFACPMCCQISADIRYVDKLGKYMNHCDRDDCPCGGVRWQIDDNVAKAFDDITEGMPIKLPYEQDVEGFFLDNEEFKEIIL